MVCFFHCVKYTGTRFLFTSRACAHASVGAFGTGVPVTIHSRRLPITSASTSYMPVSLLRYSAHSSTITKSMSLRCLTCGAMMSSP
jgi:hypothetical protein